MELEFRGQYERTTYFKAIRWIYKPSKRALLFRVSIFVVFLILYAFSIVAALREESVSSFELSRLLRHLVTFLVLAYFIFQPYIKAYQAASQLWADPVTRRPIRGRLSSQGVQIDPSTAWMAWDSFIKVHKSEDLVVLLTAKWSFVILPRKFFQSDSEWNRVSEMIAYQVNEAIE